MKAYAAEHPGDITDLGNGTYFENTNIIELTDQETGSPYFEFDAELKLWPTAPAVPEEVYAWRIRLAAQMTGLKPSIDNLLDQLPEPGQSVAKEAWYNGVSIRRDSPMVAQISAALGLTGEQVDGLFVQANEIQI